MKALIVVDTQDVLVNFRDNKKVVDNIKTVIKHFRENNYPVIFTQHLEDNPEGFFFREKEDVKIHDGLLENDLVIEKSTPSIFKNTKLDELLKEASVDHITIVGFNTEFCCMFSAIAAFDRGYQVRLIEDACGTANDDETYEMPGLDINDFVGTVLDWSSVIEVIYTEEL